MMVTNSIEIASPIARRPPRCGICDACTAVDVGRHYMLQITHAASIAGHGVCDDSVKHWNQLLYDNPCSQWSQEVCDELAAVMLQSAPAVRPDSRKTKK